MAARRVPKIESSGVTKILRDLVAIKSINPSAPGGNGENEIAQHIGSWLKEHGLEVTMQGVVNGRKNVVGVLRGTGGGRALMLNGHTDTVAVEGMIIDPYEGRVDSKGNLHGRGACDMKGSIASMMAAVEAIVKEDVRLRGDLIFTGVADEEDEGRGTMKVIERFRADGAIVGEPTSLQIAIAHKGSVWFEITTKGRAAHGSVPEKGIDAIVKTSQLVLAIEKLKKRHRKIRHPLVGTPRIHTSTIAGGTQWTIVPERCVLRVERRTLPGETTESVVKEMQSVLDELSSQDEEFVASLKIINLLGAFEESRNATIVEALSRAISAKGMSVKIIGVPYGTDACILKNRAGIPTCVFGPGDIGLAHSADEYIPVPEVVTGAKLFFQTITDFCGVVE